MLFAKIKPKVLTTKLYPLTVAKRAIPIANRIAEIKSIGAATESEFIQPNAIYGSGFFKITVKSIAQTKKNKIDIPIPPYIHKWQ